MRKIAIGLTLAAVLLAPLPAFAHHRVRVVIAPAVLVSPAPAVVVTTFPPAPVVVTAYEPSTVVVVPRRTVVRFWYPAPIVVRPAFSVFVPIR